MGIQINGQTDIISATDGSLTISGADLPTVTNLNATGIVTATSFSGPLTGNVTGNLNSTGVSTFTSGIVVSAGSTSAPSISPSGDSNTGIFFPSVDTVAVSYGGTEALRVDSSGRLGIGTDNPSSLLHLLGNSTQLNVQASTEESQIRISSAAGNYRRILFVDSAPTPTKNNFQIAQQEVDNSLHIGPSTAVGGFTFSGSTGLRVDASGRMTIPSQPFLSAGSVSGSVSGNNNHIWGTSGYVFTNRGNHWSESTGRFTAPVDGVYYVSAGIRYSGISVTPSFIYIQFIPSYNSSSGTPILLWSPGTESGGTYRPRFLTSLMYMRANDYVEPRLYVTSGTITIDGSSVGQTDCFLNIFLMG